MQVSAPNRVVRSYVQQLVAPPDEVLPLLCPVREADWIPGWDPRVVLTTSGVAEQDCVFVTAADGRETTWCVTRHEPRFVEMVRITPGVTACRFTIELAANGTGTSATVTYRHTSLGPEGDSFVAAFTEESYAQFMRAWEARLNHYLEHGAMLR